MGRSSARSWAAWVVAVVCAIVLWWRQDPARSAIPGVVESSRYRLGPVEGSRISAVYVESGDAVSVGQAIVRLDCSAVDTELALARGRLQENLAEVEAVAVQFADEARGRRLDIETQSARIRATLANAKGRQAARQAELNTLTDQLKRLEKVVHNRLVEADRLTELRARQERLAKETQHAPEALQAWSEMAGQVRDVLESIEQDDLSVRLRPLRARVETQTERIEHLLARRKRCVLRAPTDGVVAAVLHAGGDAVRAGETVVEVVNPRSMRVTAFAPEGQVALLQPGSAVAVSAKNRASRTVHGTVERIGPEIMEIPPRLWRVPARAEFGRAVHVRLEEHADLLPGELALVQPMRGAAQALPLPSGKPFPGRVPEVLSRRTRLEASGLAWLPERKRFLLVSDDTGLRGTTNHIPWVFSVDGNGVFDPDPIVLHGVDFISDLEAVTRAPNKTVYLLASQSASRKGRRPATRQWLLRARFAGDGLMVTGKTALYSELLAALGARERSDLGVSDRLNIEGMAWYHGGLILGLKAPQDGAGRARLWYLEDVDSLLSRGEPSSAAPRSLSLSLFGTVALPTCSVEATGGISDLLLEGNRLYILSTLPGGPACGSAWRVDLPLERHRPQKLLDWPDAKPEGIARAGAKELLVAFDTDGANPLFARLREP